MRGRRTSSLVAAGATFATVVLGGSLPALGVQTAQSAIVSANPADWTPQVQNGKVEAIAQVGTKIIIGGTFTSIANAGTGQPIVARSRIAAFDATTGVVSTTFLPSMSGEVTSIIPAGDGVSVYVGGFFTSVSGVGTSRVARLNVTTGAPVAGFKTATISAGVRDLRLLPNGQLIITGGFTKVGAVKRGQMASLNPATGALTSFLSHTFAGPLNGGALTVNKIDATPDGSKIFGIGNFQTVDGQSRSLLFGLNTSGATSVLSNWSTGFFAPGCASVFDTYMRDLDISPDGTYMVVTDTGAYGGPDSPCDTNTRWNLTNTNPDQQPVWRNVTGGDTSYAVAVTGAAVYVGGHMRWANNPYAGDAQGPGGVPREGIVALDPSTGLPLSWNPGRARGVGVFDMLATSTGLWVGSDTTRIGGEQRWRIAFMPLAGGKTPPPNNVGTLPNDVYLLGSPTASSDPSVLYRVNAGGPAIQSADDGPDWAADQSDPSPFRNSTSNSAGWSPAVTSDGTVPATTLDRAPLALFDSERWDPSDATEMSWSFPVPAGTNVQVRLYLANRCGCTANPGERIFSIDLNGSTVVNSVDLSANPGNNVGTMKSFNIAVPTTGPDAGHVDLTFLHQVENPLINGIEIINKDVAPGTGGLGAADRVRRQFWTGSGAPTNAATLPLIDAWSQDRGSFLVDGTLYSGWSDGTFRARSFNGTTFGTSTTIETYNNTFLGDIPNITGIAYTSNRIYYSLFGDSNLYWRWFTPESRVVGATRYTVEGDVGALEPDRVAGMFASGGQLYFADRTDGHLYSVALSGTGGSALSAGAIVGPASLADDTIDWRARGAFVWNGTPAP